MDLLKRRDVRLKIIGFIWLTLFLISIICRAEENPSAQCFLFRVPNNVAATHRSISKHEKWCYLTLFNPEETRIIFNANHESIRPELVVLINKDNTITHASLNAGNLSFHRVDAAEYNPFSIPLVPPTDRSPISISSNSQLLKSLHTFLYQLQTQNVMLEKMDWVGTSPSGQLTPLASATRLPFRGYWWPYSSARLWTGSQSPLAKYDKFINARQGDSSGAQDWERTHHNYTGLKWEGHCNGWAASSILRFEPKSSIYDAKSGVTFSVSDLKGILAEKDNCVDFAFFGRRYTNSTSDPNDIYPDVFHKTILYYLGRLRKPIVMDRMTYGAVENHVVSGYQLSMKKMSSSKYFVSMTLRIHGYDKSITNAPGAAPYYTKTYQYYLWFSPDGRIERGQWYSKNPDFLWVPLAFSQCAPTNPFVTEEWVESIMSRQHVDEAQ